MNCKTCGAQISKELTFCIKNNMCPVCGENIMDPKKLLQFKKLRTILDCYDFVGEEKLNTPIREKIIGIVTEHLSFEVIDESFQFTVAPVEKSEDVPSVDKRTPKPRGIGKTISRSDGKTLKNNKGPLNNNIYVQAAEEQYGADSLNDVEVEMGDDDSKDLKEFFSIGKAMDPEVLARVNKLKSKASAQTKDIKGISRIR